MIWYVAFGGAVGSACRYAIGTLFYNRAPSIIPLGTLLINIVGSFILGLITQLSFSSINISPEVRALIAVGFCGGFTTFSLFSLETASFIQQGAYTKASLYIGLSIFLSVLGLFAGLQLGRYFSF